MEAQASEGAFSLDGLVYRDTLEFAICDQDGNETAWRIVLAGPGHAATVAFGETRENLARRREFERQAAERKGKVWAPPPAAELNAEFAAQFAPRILGWSKVALGGTAFEYSAENARRLMADPALAFVASQILEQAGKLDDFFAKPAKA
jgi:hypothetical protein